LPPTETAPGCLHHPPPLPGPAKAGGYSELANCVVPRRGVLFDLSPESAGSKQAHHQGDRNRAVEVRVRCMSHLVAIGECGWSAGANGQVFAVSLALPEDVITSWARKQVSAALTEAATSTWYAALPPKEEDEWTSRGRGQVLARHGSFAGGFGVTSPTPHAAARAFGCSQQSVRPVVHGFSFLCAASLVAKKVAEKNVHGLLQRISLRTPSVDKMN
jgi:hypothetical protein